MRIQKIIYFTLSKTGLLRADSVVSSGNHIVLALHTLQYHRVRIKKIPISTIQLQVMRSVQIYNVFYAFCVKRSLKDLD